MPATAHLHIYLHHFIHFILFTLFIHFIALLLIGFFLNVIIGYPADLVLKLSAPPAVF